MRSTRLSLLVQASNGSEPAWSRLVEIYQPLVYDWLRRHDVSHHDAEELTQDVLSVVVKELPNFSHAGRPGSFRTWLRQITSNRAKGFWRAGKIRTKPVGNTNFRKMIEQLADEDSDLSRYWNRQHDQHVLRKVMSKVAADVAPSTLKAFQRLVFDGASAETVAVELGITVGATYSAKSRVLRKLREEAEGLIDESVFS